MVMATAHRKRKCSVTRVKEVKAQLDEMEQWADANLEDLRSRKRNDGEEEQARRCFKAKPRPMRDVCEQKFYNRFRKGLHTHSQIIEASPILSKQINDLDKLVMAEQEDLNGHFAALPEQKP